MHANTIVTDRGGRRFEERREQRAAIAAANAEARARWHDQGWRYEMAATMTETVYEGFAHENLLEYFTQVEYAEAGDRVTVEEVRGMEAYWVSLGGQIDQSSVDVQVMELPRDYIGWHASMLEEKMQANFSLNSTAMVGLAGERMDASINTKLFGLFQRAIQPGSDFYVHGAGLSLPLVNSALTEVKDESRSNQITIVGRATMTDQFMNEIENTGLFAPETEQRILDQGVLGTYRGANIVELTNYKDRWGRSFFPANEMWILGADASKAAFWGGLLAQEWSEVGGFYWHYFGRRAFGAIVHRPERARRVIDDSQAA